MAEVIVRVPVLNVVSPVKVSVVSGVMVHVRSPPKSGVEVEPRPDWAKFWTKWPFYLPATQFIDSRILLYAKRLDVEGLHAVLNKSTLNHHARPLADVVPSMIAMAANPRRARQRVGRRSGDARRARLAGERRAVSTPHITSGVVAIEHRRELAGVMRRGMLVADLPHGVAVLYGVHPPLTHAHQYPL
jgi:hypothetical protein